MRDPADSQPASPNHPAGAPEGSPLLWKVARLTCLLGIGFAILFSVSMLLLTSTPKAGSSDAEVHAEPEETAISLIPIIIASPST